MANMLFRLSIGIVISWLFVIGLAAVFPNALSGTAAGQVLGLSVTLVIASLLMRWFGLPLEMRWIGVLFVIIPLMTLQGYLQRPDTPSSLRAVLAASWDEGAARAEVVR